MDAGRNNLEAAFGREFSQHALNNYRGWRTWGQLNESVDTISSGTCECCAHVRQNVVLTALREGTLLWLVDVKELHHAVSAKWRKTEALCGFCSIIYQQFWTWQSPAHRLKSLLLAKELQSIEAGDETAIYKLWNDLNIGGIGDATLCYLDHTGNSAKGCPSKTCNVCDQDNMARLELGKLALLCEPCKSAIASHEVNDSDDPEFRPIIPLLLRPTIVDDASSLSTLAVKHAAGVSTNNGFSQEWILAMYTLPDDKAASFIPPFRNASYDHDAVYDQIRAWTEICDNHPTCQLRRSNSPKLPRRVLELNGSQCRLRETLNEPENYVALSYCWGAPQPERLVGSNLGEYKIEINVQKLPATIQHAITATKKLGFKHLWIDSMCIIQDSEADKLSEIVRMRDIYAQSSLTICASGARTCNEGFFNIARNPGTSIRMPDIGVNYPCTLPDGSTGNVRLIERAEYRPQVEALTSRGWTYQEEMLPTSIVRFGACLSWECDELSDSRTLSSLTGGIDSKVPFSTLFLGTDTRQHLMRRTLHTIFAPPDTHSADRAIHGTQDRETCPATQKPAQDHTSTFMMQTCTCDDGPFFAAWQLAVSNYTDRNLSDPSDKLPALGGLAEAFSRVRKDEYLAGLWRRRMIHDLMWTVRALPKPKDGDVRRREPWRAPSWSWACLNSGITVVGAHNRILECQLDNCTLLQQRTTAEVVDCGVDYYDPLNPFGAVTQGSITLHGPLIKLKLVKGKYFTMLRLVGCEFQIFSESMGHMCTPADLATPHLDLVYYQNSDLEGDVEEGVDVWCLQLREETVQPKKALSGRSESEPVLLMDGLILLPSLMESGAFRRIGVWVTDYRGVIREADHPFRKVDAQVVKIL